MAKEERPRKVALPEARPEQGASLLTTAALIGVAAMIEAELLPGMLIGAGLALASSWLPDLVGDIIRPVAKTAVKAGYAAVAKASEVMAEAGEQLEDMVAEAKAEHESETIH